VLVIFQHARESVTELPHFNMERRMIRRIKMLAEANAAKTS
jgi:hypothetical protein